MIVTKAVSALTVASAFFLTAVDAFAGGQTTLTQAGQSAAEEGTSLMYYAAVLGGMGVGGGLMFSRGSLMDRAPNVGMGAGVGLGSAGLIDYLYGGAAGASIDQLIHLGNGVAQYLTGGVF